MSMIATLRRLPDGSLQDLLARPETVEDVLEEEGIAELDLDKAWHALHFLLTRTAWEGEPPLDFLVRGGKDVGDVEVGYGPARAFLSTDVRAVWKALEGRSADSLREAYDAVAMRALQIYPTGWRTAEQDNLDSYYLDYYEQLRQFIRATAAKGEGFLLWVS